jgi:prepilin-type N-terminal cleavage/methylation domain-containing protein
MPSPTTNHQPPITATHSRARRPGFTLTELLVVIAIIAVLASLVSVGVMRTLDTAKQTTIKAELDQIDMAFRAYKDKYGEYPPCDLADSPFNNAAIKRHVARAFPRYYDITRAPADIRAYVTDSLRPDQAIVFWLGGFHPDPSRPFDSLRTLTKAQRKDALFDFDESRLVDISTAPVTPTTLGGGRACPSYIPKGVKTNAPYVYFDAATYTSVNTTGNRRFPFSTPLSWEHNTAILDNGRAMAYFHDSNGDGKADFDGTPPDEDYVNTDSFQLIAPGIDGKYGAKSSGNTLRVYPIGTGYDPLGTEEDNVVNFNTKTRLGDARP